jgi:hypothetical protein
MRLLFPHLRPYPANTAHDDLRATAGVPATALHPRAEQLWQGEGQRMGLSQSLANFPAGLTFVAMDILHQAPDRPIEATCRTRQPA